MVRDWPGRGYIRFPWHPATHRWSQAARRTGIRVVRDPVLSEKWLHCEGTWFVGVDALPTEPDGSIGGVPLLGPFLSHIGTRSDLHPAQLSVTYPGYPRPRAGESDAAFGYRLRRDAAHMDGLQAEGAPRRRLLRERHDWILGLPLTETSPGASPLVVWEGSHHILRSALVDVLAQLDEEHWPSTDITEVYTKARQTAFATCRRVVLPSRPGEAVLLNPFLLHGVAPWQASAMASRHGRMVAYFRPETADSPEVWLRQN